MKQFEPHREFAKWLRDEEPDDVEEPLVTNESLAHTRLYLDGRQVHGPAEDIAALKLVLDKRQGALRRQA